MGFSDAKSVCGVKNAYLVFRNPDVNERRG